MNKEDAIQHLKKATRSIPDYPKPGIVFRDLTTIFQDGNSFSIALDLLMACLKDENSSPISFSKLAGIEARGFVLAGALAARMGGGVALLRKPGKLPAETVKESYALEYGEDAVEMHRDGVKEGMRILIVDDLLATGGTAAAAGRLVTRLGGEVVGMAFLIELCFLEGRSQLGDVPIHVLLRVDGE